MNLSLAADNSLQPNQQQTITNRVIKSYESKVGQESKLWFKNKHV